MGEGRDRETLVVLAGQPRTGGLLDRVEFSGLILFTLGTTFSITFAQVSFYGLVLLPWLVGLVLTRKPPFPKSRIVYAAMALLGAYLLATLLGINWVASLRYIKKLGLFFILFLAPPLLVSRRRLSLITKVLIVGLTANALYGIAESAFRLDYYRARGYVGGTFGFCVTFGGVLVLSSLITYGRVWMKAPLKYRLAYAGAFAVQVTALFLTKQRNALVGLVAGLLFFTLLVHRRYALLAVVLAVGGSLLLPHPMRDKILRTRLTERVVESRLSMWSESIPLIARHPVTGVGPGNVKQAFREEVPDFEMHFRHVHNNYLQVLVELGLIGFAAFLWMFTEGLKGALRHHFKHKGSDDFLSLTSLSAGAAIAGFLAAGFFEFNFGDSEVTMPIWLLLGIVVAIERGIER